LADTPLSIEGAGWRCNLGRETSRTDADKAIRVATEFGVGSGDGS
jgi:hypothetical protein